MDNDVLIRTFAASTRLTFCLFLLFCVYICVVEYWSGCSSKRVHMNNDVLIRIFAASTWLSSPSFVYICVVEYFLIQTRTHEQRCPNTNMRTFTASTWLSFCLFLLFCVYLCSWILIGFYSSKRVHTNNDVVIRIFAASTSLFFFSFFFVQPHDVVTADSQACWSLQG